MRCELAQPRFQLAPKVAPAIGPRRRSSDNSTSRAVGAALVAGGLAFSISLYPLPDGPQLWDLLAPTQEASSAPAKVIQASFLNLELPELDTLDVPDLAKLAALSGDPTALPTSELLDLAMTYGMPDVMRALGLIQSYSTLAQSFPAFSGGWGGDTSSVPLDVWPALVWLLEYLQQNPPQLSNVGLIEMITTFFATVAPALDISKTQPAPLIEVQSTAVDVAPPPTEVAPAPVPFEAAAYTPVSTPTEYSITPTAEAAIVPATEVTIVSVTEVTLAPTTEMSASPSTEASASAEAEPPPSTLAESSGTTHEPSNSVASEPDPPNSDSPSSPVGGAGADSPDNNDGSPGGAGGDGPSENSGGGSPGGE